MAKMVWCLLSVGAAGACSSPSTGYTEGLLSLASLWAVWQPGSRNGPAMSPSPTNIPDVPPAPGSPIAGGHKSGVADSAAVGGASNPGEFLVPSPHPSCPPGTLGL